MNFQGYIVEGTSASELDSRVSGQILGSPIWTTNINNKGRKGKRQHGEEEEMEIPHDSVVVVRKIRDFSGFRFFRLNFLPQSHFLEKRHRISNITQVFSDDHYREGSRK
jgi:hypothetical protein